MLISAFWLVASLYLPWIVFLGVVVAEATHALPNVMGQMVTVRLDQIKVNEQARKHFDQADLQALGANIREHGLLVPLLVKRCGDLFELVAGERRLRAMLLSGLTECRVIVLGEMDAGETEVVQWIENANRSDLLPAERADALRNIKEKKGWSNKLVSEHLHIRDASLVTRYLALFATIPDVQEAARADRIGLQAWYNISLLPPEQQSGLLQMHLAGIPAAQIAEISRKKRKPASDASTVRVNRFKSPVPGKKAVVQISGEGITLDDMLEALIELVKEGKKASERGLDAKTFERVCRDLAKKG